MGASQEIHDRERELILRLAREWIQRLRNEGGLEEVSPAEVEWGKVEFRVKFKRAPIEVTLQISP